MSSEQIETRLQRLQAEQALILDQVDNAIALFDSSHRLVLFNQKLAQMWGLTPSWLEEQPDYNLLIQEVAAQGYWSLEQCQELEQVLRQGNLSSRSFNVVQSNGIYLEVCSTLTSAGGWLLIFRDITSQQQYQANLANEVKRLTFLLGLTERLQTSTDLNEIGKFALSYLVPVMNSAFGDVKVVKGVNGDRWASPLLSQVSGEFIATYGQPVVDEMLAVLDQGIPYQQGLLWQVVETGQPLFIEDYANHPKAVPGFRHPGIGQLGIFPIPSTDGTIIGVLTLESRSLQKLQEAPQQDMLLAACRTLGVAIERAQAQERMQKINQDLERASQLKSEFLASMSHELRTPLNSILGFSGLLKTQLQGELNRKQLQYISLIHESGQHLLSLINDILDLSKVEAGKEEINVDWVPIRDLCIHCLEMVQPRADKKRIALSLELDYRLNEVALDERRARQMVINLLSNAVKFTPEQGQIKLSGRLAYGSQLLKDVRPDRSPVNLSTPYLCLEVVDSGIGIPTEKQHLLFQPFQQIDSSLTRQHEGTGLGLALTKRLAELHGGTVSLQSEEGKGSTFRVWLPLTEMRETLAASHAPPSKSEISIPLALQHVSPSQDLQRILVVEDQPYNQVLLSELLELEGYGVELISDGRVMLETIQSGLVTEMALPDLIFMDIQLPGVDGFELIRQLKIHPLWQRVPVIAVTAMAMAGDRDRCLEVGADTYLSKPLDLNEVLIQTRSFLARADE